MIRFISLSLANFLSFREPLHLPLDAQGLTLLEGENLDDAGSDSNMAGKSSLFEAIVWALYGETLRYGRDSDAVVNRFVGKDCQTCIRFIIKGTRWRVNRFRKHSKHSNHVWLVRENKNISADRDEDTQAMIEDLLGIGYEPFTHCVLFGGARPFAELTDAEQKKVLESFLGFEKFDLALQRTRRQKAEAIVRLEALREKHTQARETLAESKAAWNAAKEQAESYRKNLEERLHGLETQLEQAKEQIEGVPFFSLDTAREGLQDAVRILQDHRQTAAEEQGKYSAAWDAYNAAKRLVEAKKCPTCGQPTLRTVLPALPPKIFLGEAQANVRGAEKCVEDCRLAVRDAQLHENAVSLIVQIEDRIREERSYAPDVDEDNPALRFSRSVFAESRRRMEVLECLSLKRDLEFWEEGFGNSGIKSLIVKRSLPVLNARVSEIASRLLNGTLEFSAVKTLKSGAERNLFHVRYEAKHGADRYDGESSGGRRRVDICILLCFSFFSRFSNLLLVDELLDSLDESGREAALEILADLRPTVIVISHRKDVRGAGQRWVVQKKNGSSTLLLGQKANQ